MKVICGKSSKIYKCGLIETQFLFLYSFTDFQVNVDIAKIDKKFWIRTSKYFRLCRPNCRIRCWKFFVQPPEKKIIKQLQSFMILKIKQKFLVYSYLGKTMLPFLHGTVLIIQIPEVIIVFATFVDLQNNDCIVLECSSCCIE